MSNVEAVGGSSPISSAVAGGLNSGSIQFIFAQLQIELGIANKEAALDKIKYIREQQEESKRLTDAINSLRDIKSLMGDDELDIDKVGNLNVEDIDAEIQQTNEFLSSAKELRDQAALGAKGGSYLVFSQLLGNDLTDAQKINMAGSVEAFDAGKKQAQENEKDARGEYESTMMPADMENYFKSQKIDYADYGVSARQNEKEWNEAIKNLEGRVAMLTLSSVCEQYGLEMPSGDKLKTERIDTIIAQLESIQEETGSDIQQQMVFIQDYMGQYNSYTQGASSAISKASDVLSSIVTGR